MAWNSLLTFCVNLAFFRIYGNSKNNLTNCSLFPVASDSHGTTAIVFLLTVLVSAVISHNRFAARQPKNINQIMLVPCLKSSNALEVKSKYLTVAQDTPKSLLSTCLLDFISYHCLPHPLHPSHSVIFCVQIHWTKRLLHLLQTLVGCLPPNFCIVGSFSFKPQHKSHPFKKHFQTV